MVRKQKIQQLLFTVFYSLIGMVLAATVLDWLFHFSEPVNRLIQIVMFSLIGTAYLLMAYAWSPGVTRLVLFGCGLLLIGFNFLGSNNWSNGIRIVCILVPMLIARFRKEKPATEQRSENAD